MLQSGGPDISGYNDQRELHLFTIGYTTLIISASKAMPRLFVD